MPLKGLLTSIIEMASHEIKDKTHDAERNVCIGKLSISVDDKILRYM